VNSVPDAEAQTREASRADTSSAQAVSGRMTAHVTQEAIRDVVGTSHDLSAVGEMASFVKDLAPNALRFIEKTTSLADYALYAALRLLFKELHEFSLSERTWPTHFGVFRHNLSGRTHTSFRARRTRVLGWDIALSALLEIVVRLLYAVFIRGLQICLLQHFKPLSVT
jgi:hypothetical protein